VSGGIVDNELSGPVEGVGIQPTEPLCIPHRKRLSHSYVVNDEGVRELRIDYGLKEITFDEERFFPFGEQLVREPRFTGQMATTWGPGYAWDEIRPLLEALMEEGIVQRGDNLDDFRGGGLVPSKLPPSVCPVPRYWSVTETESITREIAERPVEVGYMEIVCPVWRIAHAALDADGRQVGEGNVHPRRLRLDLETEWRVCQYSGCRYRDEMPMNVTALKAMIKYWKPMMTMATRIRDELERRLGIAHAPWNIGKLHLYGCVVLAVPAYLLLKGGGTSPQVPLHPVLSSLFRVTDGIRMTTSSMLFSIEHTRRADEPLTAAQLHAHVEMNGVFVGETGVCAGPKPMVDEFLATAIDGRPAEGIAGLELPAQVSQALDELPEAVDYSFYALQSESVSLSTWLAMSRAYQDLLAILEPVLGATAVTAAAEGDRWGRLVLRCRAAWRQFNALQITFDYDREVHHKMYLNVYEQAWRGSRTPVGPATLAEAVAPVSEGPLHREAGDQLRRLLAPLVANTAGAALDVDRIVEVLVRYLRAEQACLASTVRLQEAINTMLDRPRPRRALTVRDFAVNYSLQSSQAGAWPYLFDVLEEALGIGVESTATTIEVSERRTS
jgi:hypothetical protein